MLMACKCLNILLEVELNTSTSMDVNSLQMDERLPQDVFFNQEIKHVLRMSKLTKMLPMLVSTRAINHWTLEYCINCNVHTHAVMTGAKGVTVVLINANLLSGPEIDEVRKQRSYSKVYKVVTCKVSDVDKRYDYLPAEVEQSIRTLKQKADDSFNAEATLIDERIRIYTDQQLQILEDFKEKAYAENKALRRVLLKHHLADSTSNSGTAGKQRSTNSELARREQSSKAAASNLRKVPDEFDEIVKPSSPQKDLTVLHETPISMHSPLQKKNSLDAECLFDIEGMDDTDALDDADYSDGDDNGIPIKQNRNAQHNQQEQYNIAKSLPMDIPTYLSVRSQLHDDSDEDSIQAEKTKDIAASIQALARSVNGDAVFGDLPRNRCRTNIF